MATDHVRRATDQDQRRADGPNLVATVLGWLALALVAVVAAIWVPPALFHSSGRVVTLRLTFVSVALGGLLGAVLVVATSTRPARDR